MQQHQFPYSITSPTVACAYLPLLCKSPVGYSHIIHVRVIYQNVATRLTPMHAIPHIVLLGELWDEEDVPFGGNTYLGLWPLSSRNPLRIHVVCK